MSAGLPTHLPTPNTHKKKPKPARTGALLLGGHVENAVGVDVEDDGDLGHAPGGGRYAAQLELAQQVVVARHGPLALEHLGRALILEILDQLGARCGGGGYFFGVFWVCF